MLKKFWCWFFGCETVIQKYTGETFKSHNNFAGQNVDHACYVLTRTRFCVRCGKPNPYYDEKVPIA